MTWQTDGIVRRATGVTQLTLSHFDSVKVMSTRVWNGLAWCMTSIGFWELFLFRSQLITTHCTDGHELGKPMGLRGQVDLIFSLSRGLVGSNFMFCQNLTHNVVSTVRFSLLKLVKFSFLLFSYLLLVLSLQWIKIIKSKAAAYY